MARLLTCGWETGLANEAGAAITANGGVVTAVTTAPTPRSGTYCAKCAAGTATNNSTAMIPFTAPSSVSEMAARFGAIIHMISANATAITVLLLYDSLGAAQLSLTYDKADQLFRLYRGDKASLLAAALAPLSLDTQALLQWRAVIDSSTGVFQLWLDKALVMDFSGNTQQTANANVQAVRTGYRGQTWVSAGDYVGLDDLAINDTSDPGNGSEMGVPGDAAVLYLAPSGNGATTQLTNSAGNQTNNYTYVDDIPAATSDYVASTATSQYDTYALGDLSTAYNTVILVQPIAYAALAVAGTGSLRNVIRSSSADYSDTADSALTTSYQCIRGKTYYTDPSDSGGWTPARVNSLEEGPKVI